MVLFERNYKAAATTEIERSVRDLEERDWVTQNPNHTARKAVFLRDATDADCNLNFAERLNLISSEQAVAYRDRIFKARLAFSHMERMETRNFVDDLENPRERSIRYQNMDAYNAQIEQERIKNSDETETGIYAMEKEMEERVR